MGSCVMVAYCATFARYGPSTTLALVKEFQQFRGKDQLISAQNRLLLAKAGRGGGGKTYRKAKPREDGLSETIFRDPPKMVSEEVS